MSREYSEKPTLKLLDDLVYPLNATEYKLDTLDEVKGIVIMSNRPKILQDGTCRNVFIGR